MKKWTSNFFTGTSSRHIYRSVVSEQIFVLRSVCSDREICRFLVFRSVSLDRWERDANSWDLWVGCKFGGVGSSRFGAATNSSASSKFHRGCLLWQLVLWCGYIGRRCCWGRSSGGHRIFSFWEVLQQLRGSSFGRCSRLLCKIAHPTASFFSAAREIFVVVGRRASESTVSTASGAGAIEEWDVWGDELEVFMLCGSWFFRGLTTSLAALRVLKRWVAGGRSSRSTYSCFNSYLLPLTSGAFPKPSGLCQRRSYMGFPHLIAPG